MPNPWRRAIGGLLLGLPLAAAGPYVAWTGNVPVHSPSPEARIMVADLAGGVPTNVSQDLPAARAPAWTPDGSRLVFEALAEGANDLFSCRPDGSERTNLTETPDLWESSPCCLDATRAACLVGTDRTTLWTVDAASGQRRPLATPPAFYSPPAASPDGRWLAVVQADHLAGPGRLLLVPADGSTTVRTLSEATALYSVPAFVPSGDALLVAFDGASIGGVTRGLARFPLEGPGPQLLADDAYPFSALAVAPSGTQAAYASAAVYHDTWITLVGVADKARKRLDISGFHIIAWPGFTPDGRRLAFEGVQAARYTVNLLDLETGQVTCLTPAGDTGVHPVVSPR